MTNIQDFEQRLNQLQADFEEWKKGENKSKRWVPEKEENYYYIDSFGIIGENTWDNGNLDQFRLSQNNIFQTAVEALHHLECLKTKSELRALAEELNGDEVLNWSVSGQLKYYIYLDCEYKNYEKIAQSTITYFKHSGQVYCLHKNFKDKAIERIGEQRLKDMILEGV